MVLWQGFFRKYAKTTQKTTKFTTWRRFIWTTFALTKLFNCLRLLLYVQIQSPNAAKNKAPSDDGALFFATFGDGAKNFFAPLLMPRGSAPIIPRGSAFRICRWQIHGNNTVTDIYIRYDYKNVDRANRNIIDFVNSDEEEY